MFKNEDSLLAALKKGDNKAFKEVYRLAFGKVENFILLNSGQEDDARNIFQDSMIVLLKAIKKPDFKLTSKISTYVYSISRNIWLKYIRDKMGKEVNIIDDDESNFITIAEEDDDTIEIEERYELVRKEIENLGEPCKTIIMLAHYQKLKHEEIAQMMEYTKDYVRIRLFRCMASLRKAIKQ